MNKNKILNAILFISKFSCILLLLLALVITAALIHWHINPEFYAHIPIQALSFQTLLLFTRIETSSILGQNLNDLPTIDTVGYLSIYFIYLQAITVVVLILISIREFINVINSVKKIQTFVSQNIYSFKKIGFSSFLIVFISGFQIISFKHGIYYGLYFHIMPLIVALVAYTLSEVFNEGNALLEEARTTI